MPARFGKKFLTVWLVVGVAVLLAACGDNTATNSAAPAAVATPVPPTPTPAAFPVVSGLQELTLAAATLTSLSNSGGFSAVKDLKVKVFVSDDTLAKVKANVESALTTVGYTGLSLGNSPTNFSVFYRKVGSVDIFYAGFDHTEVEKGGATPELIKIADLTKGKQSVLLVFSGTDILSVMSSAPPKIGEITAVVQKGFAATSTPSPTTKP